MSNDKAAQAREGLLDNLAGKAKEVAGAVSGKNDLVEEGQLQQAEAANRKEALADEAIADAKREEAVQDLNETTREATNEKGAARVDAEREGATIQQQRDNERALADADAARQEAADKDMAEKRADELAEARIREAEDLAEDATSIDQQTTSETVRLEREAAAADHQAARLRADTEN